VPSESDALALIEIVAGAEKVAPLLGLVIETVGALLLGPAANAHVPMTVISNAKAMRAAPIWVFVSRRPSVALGPIMDFVVMKSLIGR
jgi:hypothetical protein